MEWWKFMVCLKKKLKEGYGVYKVRGWGVKEVKEWVVYCSLWIKEQVSS